MRILFIQPKAGFLMRGTTYPVCRSMLVTASYMKTLGHQVTVFDRCIDFRKYEKVIESFRPECAMIYVPPTASVDDAKALSAYCRKAGAFTVWGEVVASAVAEPVVAKGLADYVITGETEEKLRLLTECRKGTVAPEDIPGLTYMKDGKVITNANCNNSDLAALPEIDWELVDVNKCFREFPGCRKMLYMYTSRGCPFRCSYCYNTMFYNSEHRKRDIDHVLNEIKYLEETYGLDGVNFSDELLLLTEDEIQRIRDFREKNNLSFIWGGEIRADSYKGTEILRKMYDAGCRWALIGIETGSHVTREQINKPMNQEMIRDFVDRCTKTGISTFGSFIIGFPDETREQLRETAQFALSLNLDAFLFNFFVVIPGTPLGNKLVSEGKINVESIVDSASASTKLQKLTDNYSLIPMKELTVVKSYFDWLTFTRKKRESQLKNPFMKKALDTLKHFAQGSIADSISNVYNAGKTFLTVVFYSHAYPAINKKYGLYNVNKKNKKNS